MVPIARHCPPQPGPLSPFGTDPSRRAIWPAVRGVGHPPPLSPPCRKIHITLSCAHIRHAGFILNKPVKECVRGLPKQVLQAATVCMAIEDPKPSTTRRMQGLKSLDGQTARKHFVYTFLQQDSEMGAGRGKCGDLLGDKACSVRRRTKR